jgi:acetyl-CoA acetyltransferase
MLTRRHMHLYGTKPEALKEIVQATRANTHNRPKAVRRNRVSDDEYWGSPMLADPLRRLDFCLETDGAVAVITTTIDRARDCRHKPAIVHACAHGGQRGWGCPIRTLPLLATNSPPTVSGHSRAFRRRTWMWR